MLFMVIETFQDNNMLPVYQRLQDKGRGLPDGLKYVDSWIESNFSRCLQLMECSDPALFQQWVLHWQGTGAKFEFVPVVPSARNRELLAPHLMAASAAR